VTAGAGGCERGFDGRLFKGPRQEAVGLYRAFLASPNFTLWLRKTVAAAFRTELTARDLSSTLAACSARTPGPDPPPPPLLVLCLVWCVLIHL